MSRSLHIVLDARATTEHFPGVARATLGLLRGLSQIAHDHRVSVLCLPDAPPLTHPAFHDSRIARIVTQAPPLGLGQQWRLPILACALRADLWHAPYYVRPLWGVPRPLVTVFDVIGHIVPGALPNLRARLLFEATLRLSLRAAAHVITSSEATRRDLESIYGVPRAAITVIPLAADESFRPRSTQEIAALRDRSGLPPRYVLYVGSNKPHKNLDALIRAWAQVETDAILVIAGRWDHRYESPKRLTRALHLDSRIRFIHDAPEVELPALLSGATAFVFPSRYEGFGLPPLEAMACGAPVIAANTSSLPEVVGDGGLLVAPDATSLAAAIQRVLDDSYLREQLRERGPRRAQQFSWTRVARETIAVYERVSDPHPRPFSQFGRGAVEDRGAG
jgi:glycosyltransferase involved in cell wall biosynthesis